MVSGMVSQTLPGGGLFWGGRSVDGPLPPPTPNGHEKSTYVPNHAQRVFYFLSLSKPNPVVPRTGGSPWSPTPPPQRGCYFLNPPTHTETASNPCGHIPKSSSGSDQTGVGGVLEMGGGVPLLTPEGVPALAHPQGQPASPHKFCIGTSTRREPVWLKSL